MRVEGTLTGNTNVRNRFETDTTKFGIAQEAHGLIMKYLTELYDDPTLAAVRETISNALDAHTKAGSSEPVQITVASTGHPNPFFEVTDTGVGMSRDTLTNVYTQYGVSTKSDDDESIGGFGLGCKSPLAIEDRFYVETTQDGTTIVAEIYKSNTGEFVLDINDEYDSDKSNGTTVRINLVHSSINYFRDKVNEFLQYVDPKKYVVNTTSAMDTFRVDYILDNTDKYIKISETDEYTTYANMEPDYYDSAIIIMGDVAYKFKIPDSIVYNSSLGRDAMKVVVVAPINSVTITTSRENVQETKKTKTFLEKMYLQYEKDIAEYFQKYVDEAETPMEVYSRSRKANRIARADYTYKGEEIVSKIDFTHQDTEFVSKRQGSAPYKDWRGNVPLAGSENVYFVLPDDTPDSKEGAVTRAYNSFLKAKDLDTVHFYFLKEDEPTIDSWWVAENPNFKFINKGDILSVAAEYRKEQRRLNGTTGNRRAGKVKYQVINNVLGEPVDATFIQEIEYPEIETGIPYITMEDVVAMGLTKTEREGIYAFRHGLKRILDFFEFEGELLVLDPGKKEETMVKRTDAVKYFPDVLSLEDRYEECEKHALTKLSKKPNFIDKVRSQVGQDLFDQLLDPRFVTAIPSFGMESDLTDKEYEHIRSIVFNMFRYQYNGYYYENADKIHSLKEKFQTLGTYWWDAKKTNELYKPVLSLEQDYHRFFESDLIFGVNSELLVKIYNTIYDDYLTNS